MRELAKILEESGGVRPDVVFGRTADAKEGVEHAAAKELATDRLIERLDGQVAFNNRLIVVIGGSYVAILVIFSVLAAVNRNNLVGLAAFLGGNLLALVTVGNKLQDLWREKNYMDVLLAILPSLSRQEAMKVLQSFYATRVKSSPALVAATPNSDSGKS